MRNHPIALNLRGTSGSGKTTLAREIMAVYTSQGETTRMFREGRKRPILTQHQHPSGGRPLAVLGHYEAACGGCDTITELDDVFGLVREQMDHGFDVLFEGLILSGEIIRTDALVRERPTNVFVLNTPIDKCIQHVGDRREARGAPREFKHKNTIAKARCVELTMKRLEGVFAECASQGCEARWGTFDEGLAWSKGLLNV